MSTEHLDGGPIYESDFSLDSAGRLWESSREVLPLPPLVARAFEPAEPAPAYKIVIYLDDGVTFNYSVDSMSSAREHVSAIIATGYRSVQEKQPNILVHYPPHRIQKVKIIAPEAIETGYRDRASGT